jgi:hypothetical protein
MTAEATIDRRAFLAFFPDHDKSHITNIFLHAIRAGAPTVDIVYRDVEVDLRERLREAALRRDKDGHAKIDTYLYYFEHFPDAACRFAAWALDWEKLTPEQKAKEKAKKAATHIHSYMEGQSPTERQIAYLRSLGWRGDITSKAHASDLISAIKAGTR